MPLTAAFLNDPTAFCGARPVGVDERGIAGVKPAAGAGNTQQLVAANYVFDWTMEPFGGSEALFTVHAGAVPGRQRGFFLPWEADAAISFDIDNTQDWCFTSTLTGCTVAVVPLPAGGVRVTHANARASYNQVFTVTSTLVAPERAELQQADRMATAAAAGAIGHMIGPPQPNQRSVAKRDYAAQVNAVNLRAAKRRFQPPPGERVTRLAAAETSGKPEVSCFVWGRRDAVLGWRFWYQSTVQVTGTLERGFFRRRQRAIYGQSVVLGAPIQFYP